MTAEDPERIHSELRVRWLVDQYIPTWRIFFFTTSIQREEEGDTWPWTNRAAGQEYEDKLLIWPDDPKSAPVKRWRQEKSLNASAAEDNRKHESVIRVSVLGQIYAVKWSLQGNRRGQTTTHTHIHTQGSSDMPRHLFPKSVSLDCWGARDLRENKHGHRKSMQ